MYQMEMEEIGWPVVKTMARFCSKCPTRLEEQFMSVQVLCHLAESFKQTQEGRF